MFSSKSWSITRPNVYRRSNEDALDSVGGRLGPPHPDVGGANPAWNNPPWAMGGKELSQPAPPDGRGGLIGRAAQLRDGAGVTEGPVRTQGAHVDVKTACAHDPRRARAREVQGDDPCPFVLEVGRRVFVKCAVNRAFEVDRLLPPEVVMRVLAPRYPQVSAAAATRTDTAEEHQVPIRREVGNAGVEAATIKDGHRVKRVQIHWRFPRII